MKTRTVSGVIRLRTDNPGPVRVRAAMRGWLIKSWEVTVENAELFVIAAGSTRDSALKEALRRWRQIQRLRRGIRKA